MVYKPPMTTLRILAEERDWTTVCGTEVVLVSQRLTSVRNIAEQLTLRSVRDPGELLRFVSFFGCLLARH